MSTPILNPNVSSSPSQLQIELSKILQKHDPDAVRLYEFLNHVKVFHYNSTELRWENNPFIQGNLFGYKKQQVINNQIHSSFAFAVINGEHHYIQEVSLDIIESANKLFVFYEIGKNDQRHVFSIHHTNENECQRLHVFINRAMESVRYIQQQIPVINNNSNSEDPTSSLKRLLNISHDNQSINLIPPSAFETPSSPPMNTEPNPYRDYFRQIFLHLIQTNDQFFDKIHQAQ